MSGGKRLKKIHVTNFQMVSYSFAYLAFIMTLLTVGFATTGFPIAESVDRVSADSSTMIRRLVFCTTDQGWQVGVIVLQSLLLVVAVYLAIETKNVHVMFNESAYIG